MEANSSSAAADDRVASRLKGVEFPMEIGAFEAKNRLGMLLDRVAEGEEIVITRHGKPAARLVPYEARIDKSQVRTALDRIRARAGESKEAFDWAALKADRDAGRR